MPSLVESSEMGLRGPYSRSVYILQRSTAAYWGRRTMMAWRGGDSCDCDCTCCGREVAWCREVQDQLNDVIFSGGNCDDVVDMC